MKITDEYVRAVLSRRVDAGSYRKVAAELGFTAAYLHDILAGRRAISENLGKRLGFDLVPPEPTPNQWLFSATEAATSRWEIENWPQVSVSR